jgi:glycosyltransferase involved in cell wall biosynthesis
MAPFADEVWVLTRANNQEVIEADPLSHTPGLNFIYYDLPKWALKFKKIGCFFHIYVLLWQWGAYRKAAKLHAVRPFDVVFHVTFVSIRYGSLMGWLGIPFIIGPVAGGERAPFRLRRGLPFCGKVNELIRDLTIFAQRYNPFAHLAFTYAEHIYVTTSDSLWLVPRRWQSKVTVHLAVATKSPAATKVIRRSSDHPQFVYAGRLYYFKGIHLAIRALAETRKTIPDATLTLIGDGPAKGWLLTVARRYGVSQAVEFAGNQPRHNFISTLRSYTALVFPSLHDSGGLVVLEALSEGIPVVCLNLGGPGVIVNDSCGFVVPVADANEAQLVTGIANSMISLGRMSSAELERLSYGAIARAKELSWASLTACIAARKN